MSDEPAQRELVCTVAGMPYYGSKAEAVAAKLPAGSPVRIIRKSGEIILGILKQVWIFEDLMFDIATESGNESGCFGLGDVVEPTGENVMSEYCENYKEMADKPAAMTEQVTELTDALQELIAWQNGPPLVGYQTGWNAAMRKAHRVLGLEEWKDQDLRR